MDLARAWGTLFEKHRLDEHDLLAGVVLVYDQHGSGYRPLPKDIIDGARSIRRERTERWTDEDWARYEALCDSKAGAKPLRVVEPPKPDQDDEQDARADIIAARIAEHVEAIAKAKTIPHQHRNGDTA
jgi:hypothetical protein